MAEPFIGFVVTSAGHNVLAKCIAGKQMVFTRVALGDSEKSNGTVVTVDATAAEARTALVSWKKDLPMTGEPTVNGGVASIKFLVQNADVTDGFWMRETGIFVRDPDTNAEVLYAYENRGNQGGWLPPIGGAEIFQQEITADIAVGNATNISVILDTSLLYVTQREFQAHIDATDPHPNDERFNQLNSRVSQTEVNIANLYTQLNIEEDLGVKPNLLLVDDFDDPTNTDYYRQKVITSAAGVNNVRVASLNGIHVGSWYTISDGTQDEFVQVTAVAQNGGASVVVFADDIANTYNLDETYLYRSTTTPQNGVGTGAGDIRSAVYPFTETWQGTAAGTSSTVYLNTTQTNQAAFTLSGDWAFNANGEFTLA